MTGILLYREVWLPRQLEPAFSTPLHASRDMWMGIYTASQERAGFINLRMVPGMRDDEPGARLHLTTRLSISMLGFPTHLAITGEAWTHNQRGLEDFNLVLESGDHYTQINGKVQNGILEASLYVADEVMPFSWPVGNSLQISGGLGMPSLNIPILHPGQEAQVQTFDPVTMRMGTARLIHAGEETLEIAGEQIETTIIRTTLSGMTTRAWITAAEEVVQAETPFGLLLKKITPAEALEPLDPNERTSIIQQLAVRIKGHLPTEALDEMRVRFRGISEDHYPPDDGRLQIHEGEGVYRFVRSALPGTISVEPLSTEEQANYLASDVFIPADHERIQETMVAIIGDLETRWDKALALHDWVYENIDKVPVISIPMALDVLRTMEGDCNEHTVLFTALTRAAAIPTRIAVGLVWSDQLQGFGYHAWPEVHIGHWIPMDPTLGEPVADATHIKLLNGNIDQWIQLVPYLGQLQIEVLSFR